MYFVEDNSDNLHRAASGKNNLYWDDCGAWTDSWTVTTHYLRENLTEIRLENGQYCRHKKVGDKWECVPLDKQSCSDDVLTKHFYASLQRDKSYKKRVMWLDNGNFAIVEYFGIFPEHIATHGSCKAATGEYVRTKPSVLDGVREKLQTAGAKPSTVYADVQLSIGPDEPGLQNLKQIHNTAYTSSLTERVAKRKCTRYNLADDVLELGTRIGNDDPSLSVLKVLALRLTAHYSTRE